MTEDKAKKMEEHPKYQAILATAQKLFWKHGVKKVSVQEICKEAGTSKMTFYKFFENKIHLAKTILDLIFEEGWAEYQSIMAEDIPYPEKVKKSILVKAKRSQGISQEFILDVYKNQELGLLEYMTAKSEWLLERGLDDFEKAQQEGYIRAGIKRAFMKYQLLKLREMVMDEALLQHYNSPEELIMELTNFLFHGLLQEQ